MITAKEAKTEAKRVRECDIGLVMGQEVIPAAEKSVNFAVSLGLTRAQIFVDKKITVELARQIQIYFSNLGYGTSCNVGATAFNLSWEGSDA